MEQSLIVKELDSMKKKRRGWLVLVLLVALLAANGARLGEKPAELWNLLCTYTGFNAMEHGWNLVLVNRENRLPRRWNAELTELSNGQSVDSRIYPSLQRMFDDMRAQGVYPVVASGFRTAEKQQQLMDDRVDGYLRQGYSGSEAAEEAKKWVAEAGFSEHQTGLAVDINADGVHSAGHQVYAWLADHAWKYGFILRYPEDKTALTGMDYEPWHYRYVGSEAAEEIYKTGVCLEEYVQTLP